MGLLDTIKPAERSYFLGLLADGLQGFNEWAQKPTQTQQMQGLPEMLGLLGTQRTLNRLSYGDPITNIGKANVPMIPQDTFDAAMLVGGLADPAAKALNAGAAAVGKRIAPAVERAVPAIMNRGGLPAQLMQDMSQGTQSPMIVWHGSPHKFDKFDASKIGTGEGAQAYGHGLYLAESPSVAKQYADVLGDSVLKVDGKPFNAVSSDTRSQAVKAIAAQGYENSIKAAKEMLDNGADPVWMKNYIADLNSLKSSNIGWESSGSVYKVDLPDEHIAKMLDWDKPLSQQAPEVRKVLQQLAEDGQDYYPTLKEMMQPFEAGNTTGQAVYHSLQREGGNAVNAARELRAAGIPGIRYLDGGSRGTGAGTSNFVIFPGNEGLLSILERNGQALP